MPSTSKSLLNKGLRKSLQRQRPQRVITETDSNEATEIEVETIKTASVEKPTVSEDVKSEEKTPDGVRLPKSDAQAQDTISDSDKTTPAKTPSATSARTTRTARKTKSKTARQKTTKKQTKSSD